MLIRAILSAALFIATAQAALAGPPSDAVGWFYSHVGDEALPENRDRFTGPAKDFLDANDKAWKEREYICLDFGITVDGQDFDADEIAKTLNLDEQVKGDDATVTASFKLFGEPRKIEYLLAKEDGDWKVADVVSLTGNWKLSEFNCE